MTKRKMASSALAGVLGVGLLGGVALGEMNIGTYNPENVFHQWHRGQELQQDMQGLEQQFMQAQQEGDQQRLMELQEEWMESQEAIVDEFQSAVGEAASEIATEAGVDAVAVEVVYTGEGVQTTDLTDQILEKINEGHEPPEQPEMMIPGMEGEDADEAEDFDW